MVRAAQRSPPDGPPAPTPGGRAAFYQHLRRDWTQIVAEADAAADADRARPEYAMEQWLAFERDYYDRILVGEEAA
jgi:hypothetical protein